VVWSDGPLDTVLEVISDAHALAGDLTQFATRCDDDHVRAQCDALRASLHDLEETLRLYGLRLYADPSRVA
jgi:hypothetical protein